MGYGKSLGQKKRKNMSISHGKFPWEKIFSVREKSLAKKEEKYVNFPWEIPWEKLFSVREKSWAKKRKNMSISHGKFPWEKIFSVREKSWAKKRKNMGISHGKNNFRYGKSLGQKIGKICQLPM